MGLRIEGVTEESVDDGFISELSSAFPVSDDNPRWRLQGTRQFVANEKNLFVIAYLDGMMAGFLYGYTLDRFDQSKKFLVYELSTCRSFRRRGVMTATIRWLLQQLMQQGYYSVWVPTGKDNIPAIGLYAKTGGIRGEDGGISFLYDLRG